MIRDHAPSTITPVVFTNMPEYEMELDVSGDVKAKQKDFYHFRKKGDI